MSRQPIPENLNASGAEPPLVSLDGDFKFTEESNERMGEPPIANIDKHEPIVTRKELWSYYRVFLFSFLFVAGWNADAFVSVLQRRQCRRLMSLKRLFEAEINDFRIG